MELGKLECLVGDSWDCNQNGVPDECEDLDNQCAHLDLDGDGIAETCSQQPPVPRPIP